MSAMPTHAPDTASWDLFCRVVDNHGDLGFGWRLAADLAARGKRVRLWVDEASALAWMAPGGAAGVRVCDFDAAAADAVRPAGVVVELFGCRPPPRFVDRMAVTRPAPVWIDVEYLSAEDWVERSHALPSPQPGGMLRWFFFPGFTPLTGGLLREPTLALPPALPAPEPGGAASVFCYANPMLAALARDWPGSLRLCPGPAQADPSLPGERLPWASQAGYDALLAGCALNAVRGEDSLVRAIWAGRPFLWQAYPLQGGAQRAKVDAMLDRLLEGTNGRFAASLRRLWWAWNGFAAWPEPPVWPDWPAWQAACLRWRERLAAQTDLTTQLIRFAATRPAA
ncbi:MAG TPA: elongation factor P maturation arginine rhamnosyltransferase EarP [Rubrivivax sp.]|jgi:hypothetical protein|nr:elongation factor P maturation arginine rhamnosyltransferase EarP [Rubrivivax sp.]